MEASAIAFENSPSKAVSQHLLCNNATAFSVATRRGLRWQQDSRARDRITLRAASTGESCSEGTAIAAQRRKPPCSFSASKSRGRERPRFIFVEVDAEQPLHLAQCGRFDAAPFR